MCLMKECNLRVTVDVNRKIVNFLNVTFDLKSGKCAPYRKPNDQPLYVNKSSNHPPAILHNLPTAISKRLSSISCDKDTFF